MPAASASASLPKTPKGPPLAERHATNEMLHGQKVLDPYRWLEDIKNPKTRAWLKNFDAYTRKALAELPKRNAISKRLEELSYLEAVSAPRRRGQRYFFSARHKDKEKTVYYVRDSKTAKPRVLLDPNKLSQDGSTAVRGLWPSHKGKWVAYKLSQNNADHATLYVMDVDTGKNSKVDVIEGARYADASWAPDGSGFYYTRLPIDPNIKKDELPGHAAVFFHKLGTSSKQDRLIHPATGNPQAFIDGDLSHDGRYLFVYVYHGWRRNDVYFKDLKRHKKWQTLTAGEDAKFSVSAHKGKFYIHSNKGAPRFRLFEADPQTASTFSSWRELVAEDDKSVMRSAQIAGGHLVLRYLDNASSQLRIIKLNGQKVRRIQLPGIGTVNSVIGRPEDDEAYFGFSSFTTPPTIYETSISKGKLSVLSKVEVPVDPKPFVVEQVWYPSKDKTPVSMFIVHRRNLVKDGSHPLLLNGYGGFNIVKEPRFRASLYLWLEQGGIFAMPNLRGGGEYGEAWHRGGMLDKKQNVFDDFIGAAEWLIQNKYTSTKKLAIEGGSNGGLLVGAAMVQRPELYRAVVCHVPLLDMIRYHRFESGRTWIGEYGSSEKADQFEYLIRYSPYHNVQRANYPSMLMLTADSDDRVDPMHARKFTAELRYKLSNDPNIFVRVNAKAGHGGGDMVKKFVAKQTDVYAYLMQELGMN
jgi:prolyl oligopeptidase